MTGLLGTAIMETRSLNKLQVLNFIGTTFPEEDRLKKNHGFDWKRLEQAKIILGENLIEPFEVERGCPFLNAYEGNVLEQFFATLPPEEKLLEIKRQGSILIAGPSRKMNTLKMTRLFPDYFSEQSHSYRGIASCSFSCKEFVEPEWLTISKDPITLPKKISHEQQTSLANSLPTAVELSWALTIQNIIHGKKYHSISVKTASDDSLFGCACVGITSGVIHFFSYTKTGRNEGFKTFLKFQS